jgi:putative endonuclease
MGGGRGDLGSDGERAAEQFLRLRRYSIIERNYRCRGGEVDLVALHARVVVFVEVKTRSTGALVGPFEAITPQKQARLIRAARHFIQKHRLHDRVARFDVVGVWREAGGLHCELIENAFEYREH